MLTIFIKLLLIFFLKSFLPLLGNSALRVLILNLRDCPRFLVTKSIIRLDEQK